MFTLSGRPLYFWGQILGESIPRGWQTRASIIPAPPPAIPRKEIAPGQPEASEKERAAQVIPIKFVAADAGFLLPGPDTLFADMIVD